MISLIICSRTSDIPAMLKTNISETIGVEYELVVVDNSDNRHSIFSAYNEGVRRANGEVLCFMHEDILYHTENWGEKILNHFEDKSIGVIGFAGAHFLPSVPTYWFTSPFISEFNLTNDNGKIIECKKEDFYQGKEIVDVVACDGFCFFVRKSVFDTISFDEKTYSGFHFYDMDICMQTLFAEFRVCLIKDILIEHEWSENPNKKGMELFNTNRDVFFNKWNTHLPISRGIEHIPDFVLTRIDRLYHSAFDAEKARKSNAYKLGKFLLSPLKLFTK